MHKITSRTIDANGLTFAIDECGDGPDVALCLHGFPESRFSWRYQLPMLAELGWHAVAPDLRGYGDSSRPTKKADYHLDHLVADAGALFDALGARRRLLIAHDWGAIIAWVFALRQTRAIEGLIVMNVPHPRVLRDVWRSSWAQKRKAWYIAFFQLPKVPEAYLGARNAEVIGKLFTGMAIDKSAFPPEVIDHYRANAMQPGALTAMVNYYRVNFPGWVKEPSPMLEVPTLLLWGEEDTAAGLELTVGYEPLVKDFELKRFPGVSHWVQQEAPGPVNDAMRDWLGRKGMEPILKSDPVT